MAARQISIWFFIGVSLFGNGLLITGAGVHEWLVPAFAPHVMLGRLHANFWWGLMLLIIGAWYCVRFAPKRERR